MTYAPPPQPPSNQPQSPQYQPPQAPMGHAAEPPISWPLYGASFGQAFTRFWKKYAVFSGRASRSEFWWWYLANAIVITVIFTLMIIGGVAGASYDSFTGQSAPGPLFGVFTALLFLWGAAIIVPSLALTWRRVQDANLPGPLSLLLLIPGLGFAALIFGLLPSNPEGRRFDR